MKDQDIIALYFDRNQEAISQTDLKYGRYCHAIAWNILYNHEDSEECVNDTWMETWGAIPPERPLSLKAFVGRLTRNNALNLYEKRNAGKRGGGEVALCLDELAGCISGENDPAMDIDYKHLVTCINEFLSLLKKEQRIIFVRRYWYGSSIQEIAADYRMTQSKVKVTLLRLRGRLKKFLKEEGVCV